MKLRNLSLLIISFLLLLISANEITPELLTAFKVNNEGEPYKVYALRLPEKVDFAGEIAPLQAPDIRERLDKELLVNTYWQSNMMLLLKRANKYFPLIEKSLEEEGVPSDFKYLAVIESALENVRSPKGAKGFWQIMPATAKEYGLEVNSNVDERYHIEKATRVACAYLKKAKKRFKSWTLAAASYNLGLSGVNRLLEKQLTNNYYDLLLNNETARYIFRIVALKEVLSYPKKYGFEFEKEDLYYLPKTKTVKVDTVISNIASFAKGLQTNYKELKLHNAWLRENKLNNKSRRLYTIKIPLRE